VTGFGLLGHLHNLVLGAGLGARLRASAVPVLGFARELAGAGLVPGGTRRNLAYVEPHVSFAAEISETERLVLCDAQTSGGLLIAVPAECEGRLVAELERRGALAAAVVGEVIEAESGGQVSVEC
jgi:selenide,water dikinase